MTKIDLIRENDSLRTKIRRLERENTFLFDEMLALTKELGIEPIYYDKSKHTWSLAMAHKASLAIKRVFEMRA